MTKRPQPRRLSSLLLVALLATIQSTDAASQFTNGQAAAVVLGQPDFVSSAAGVSAGSLNFPSGVAADASGNIWVVDHSNFRVLRFDAPLTNGKPAAIVIGQPDLTSNAQNNGGITARSLGGPDAVAVDAAGNLWIADGGANGRVLRYSPPFSTFMNASLVLGAPNFTSITPGPTQATVGLPTGLAFDPSGNVWVADWNHHRVLRFDAPFTNGEPASVVLGQTDFTSTAAPSPPTASSLNRPQSVAVDASGNIWVADELNYRALKYTAPISNGQSASTVIGQAVFTSNAPPSMPTATSLSVPRGIAFDGAGHLWITDRGRVLEYEPPFTNGQAATVVLGQPDFTSLAAPTPPTATSSSFPFGSVAFSGRTLWVADHDNNRVLAYAPPSVPPPTPPQIGGDIISPREFPYKVTFDRRCAESLAGVCLRFDIVRVCVGGNCFDPRPDPEPICVRCYMGAAAGAGAVLGAGALLLLRRRRP